MLLWLFTIILIAAYYYGSLWLKDKRCKNGKKEPKLLNVMYWPIIGHARILLGDSIDLWTRIKEAAVFSLNNGHATKLTVGRWNLYLITDPDDSFLVNSCCLQKGMIYELAKPWVGNGLVTAPVEIWKHHRKLVNPAFSQSVLDGYLTVFNSRSRNLVESFSHEVGKYFDHRPHMDKMALEIICLTAIGADDEDDVTKNHMFMENISAMFTSLTQRFQGVWTISNFLFSFSKLKKQQDAIIEVLHRVSNEFVQKRKTALIKSINSDDGLEKVPKRFKSFLDLLLEYSINDGSLSDSEIREEVDTMISAGADTSSSLLTFVLVMIGSYPEVQEKAFKEIQEVFEGSDRDVGKNDLSKLVYLEAIIKETLRLYPIIPIYGRFLDRDVELKNYTLLKGNSCFTNVYGLNRHPMWGKDADTFRPERWLHPDQLPKNPNAFAAYGIGKRSCIGPKFAQMSLKTSMCHILRQYRIIADYTKMVSKIEIVHKPHSGHYIKLVGR